jgi:hypothetical protein
MFSEGIEMEQQMVLPEGGLASFLTSNLDEIDDSRLAFGRQNGINSMRETAERMAQLGRNGDDVLIHATKKERLIPKEVSEANPELMTQVDIAIADAGADPSAYIVGSETNSVNPYTGQREFFLKKIISGVKKVFKAVAPLIIPVALNFFSGGAFGAMSLAAQGAITGGISSLVQGGNVKDALKGALIGGVMGGVSSGIQKFAGKTGGNLSERFDAGIQGFGDAFKSGPEFILGKTAGEFSNRGNVNVKVPDSTSTSPVYDRLKDTFYTPGTAGDAGLTYTEAFNQVKTPNMSDFEAGQIAQKMVGQGATEAVAGSVKLIPTAAAVLAGGAALGAFDEIPAAEVEDPYSKESASEKRLRLNRSKYAAGPNLPQENLTLQDIMVGSVPQLYEKYLDPQSRS